MLRVGQKFRADEVVVEITGLGNVGCSYTVTVEKENYKAEEVNRIDEVEEELKSGDWEEI